MYKTKLKTPHGSSEIRIGRDLMDDLREFLKECYPGSRFVIVTDSNLHKLYKDRFQGGDDEIVIVVPAGEASKDLDTIKKLATQMLEAGIARNDVVIGVGGGMITDLAGFLASIYMRGLKYVAVPTSLLAMVDAAIGGKTGVDLIAKNSIGTFYLSDYVMVSPAFLKTLPEVEMTSGMGEVIKYAISQDATLLEDLKKDPLDMETIIKKSIEAKVKIAGADFKEGDLRKTLNYGHTFGHAIEAKSNYELSHGQAISIGMCIANHVAKKLGKGSADVNEVTKALLKRFNLPTQLPADQKIEDLVDLIMSDKKRSGDSIDFIIAPGLGQYEIVTLKATKLIELAKDFA